MLSFFKSQIPKQSEGRHMTNMNKLCLTEENMFCPRYVLKMIESKQNNCICRIYYDAEKMVKDVFEHC